MKILTSTFFLIVLGLKALRHVTAEESSILQNASVVGNDIAWWWCPDPDGIINQSFKSFFHSTLDDYGGSKEAMIDFGELFKVVMVFTQQRQFDIVNKMSFGHSKIFIGNDNTFLSSSLTQVADEVFTTGFYNLDQPAEGQILVQRSSKKYPVDPWWQNFLSMTSFRPY